jgi:hypothetical protein
LLEHRHEHSADEGLALEWRTPRGPCVSVAEDGRGSLGSVSERLGGGLGPGREHGELAPVRKVEARGGDQFPVA